MNGSTPEIDVQRVAGLARLRVSPEDAASLQTDLERILAYVQRLNELDTHGIAPMPRPGDETNRLREDSVASSLDQEAIARNAAAMRDGEFVVPPVLGDAGAA